MPSHSRPSRSRDGPIITRNGTDIRRVLAMDRRRAEVRAEVARDFYRLQEDQDQQAHSDCLLDQLCELFGIIHAASELTFGCLSNGTEYALEQKDNRPQDQSRQD